MNSKSMQDRQEAGNPGKWVVGCISLIAAGAVGFIYSGVYNVAATEGHSSITEWALRTTMERSIRNQARGIQPPQGLDLTDRAVAERAIGHYSVACASCHGAPGEGRAPWMVIYPEPSLLTQAEVVSRWSDGELYWIIRNGIKDTGMMALGPTHKEDDIWAVTAFVRQLPSMSEADYRSMIESHRAAQAKSARGEMKGSHH